MSAKSFPVAGDGRTGPAPMPLDGVGQAPIEAVAGQRPLVDVPGPAETAFHARLVARNSLLLLAGQGIVFLSSALLGILVARRFGPGGYGQYALAFSFSGVFGLLFSLGSDSIVVREVARVPASARQVIGSALWLRLAFFPLAVLAVGLGARIAGYPASQQTLILLAALALGLSALAELPRSVFQGLQRMEFDLLARGVEKLGSLLVCGLFLALLPLDRVAWIVAGLLMGAAGGVLVGWLIVGRLVGVRLAGPRDALRLAREAAPLGGSLAIISLYVQLPAIVLSLFFPMSELGFYNSAFSIVTPLGVVPVVVAGALLPPLAKLFTAPGTQGDRVHRSALSLILLVSLPLAGLLSWLASDILRLLFGASFVPAGQVLRVLALQVPLSFLTTYLLNVLIAAGAQRLTLVATVANLATAIVTGLFLIPAFGATGAAATAVICLLPGIALTFHLSARWVQHGLDRKTAVALCATALMVAGAWAYHGQALSVRLPVAVGYGLLALGLLGWTARDLLGSRPRQGAGGH